MASLDPVTLMFARASLADDRPDNSSSSYEDSEGSTLLFEAIPGLDASYALVDSPARLDAMVGRLRSLLRQEQYLNVDFEGIDLCRTGKICLGQFCVANDKVVYIVDFEKLSNPFRLLNGALKDILESASTTKVFYDPRNDCDALVHQFGVHVRKALCLQTAEVAYRKSVRCIRANYVMGLGKAFDEHLVPMLPRVQQSAVQSIKSNGKALFAPEQGGDYQVFALRPLDAAVARYAAVDVLFFDKLRSKLFGGLSAKWQELVLKESNARLLECERPGYLAKGREKAIAPTFR